MTDYFMLILNNLIITVIVLRIMEQITDLLYIFAYTSTLRSSGGSLRYVIF